MRIAIAVQIAAIAIVMLPLMLGYIESGQRGLFFDIEMLVHHAIGLAVIVLWVFINLLFMGTISIRVRLVPLMRSAFVLWMLAILIGVHLFISTWL